MVMVENINIDEIQSSPYTDEVKYTVRYGYFYRREAEAHAARNAKLHYSLPEATTIFYWLAH